MAVSSEHSSDSPSLRYFYDFINILCYDLMGGMEVSRIEEEPRPTFSKLLGFLASLAGHFQPFSFGIEGTSKSKKLTNSVAAVR